MDPIRKQCEDRLASLKRVRIDYEDEWRQIARFAQPSRSRFLATNKDRGEKRRLWNKRLFDPHGIEAFRTLTNGMTSGLTSADRPWFSLRLRDDDLNEQDGVRTWLSDVEDRMYAFLARTNFYGAVKAGYGEMGLFGTEACVMVEHRTQGAVCHSLTAGEYWIGQSEALVPNRLYRECGYSVWQAVADFGYNNVSQFVRSYYDSGDYEQTVVVYQAIEPNEQHDPSRLGSKPWRSVYWEYGSPRDDLLKVSGYQEQPFWAPRWDVVGGDTYGVSPGMEALPALRELQMQAKRRNEAIDQMVKPEKVVKAGIRLTGEPGRNVSAASFDKDSVLVPYEIPYQAIEAIGQEQDKCRQQIDGLSFASLFNAITDMQGIQPRNVEEIAARNDEKMTQLGPVIERVANEKLQVCIDRTFGIMMRGGLLPPAPDALHGQQIDVEFVSILAQMQRAVGVGQIERGLGFVGNLAAAQPDALDNIDFDEAIEEYMDRLGVPPKIVRSQADVAKLRQQRAAQQNAAMAAQTLPAVKDGAEAAQLLSQTNVGGKPVIDTLAGV